jgi:hypothetical protein
MKGFLLRICIIYLVLSPFSGYAADLTIGDGISTTGDWTLNGIMNATSFSGSGSGLFDVTASALSCTGCVSQTELNFTPGTITGVNAGTGLTGGGSSGTVNLNVDTSSIQRRVSSSCSIGSSIRAINSDGTVVCQPANSGPMVLDANGQTLGLLLFVHTGLTFATEIYESSLKKVILIEESTGNIGVSQLLFTTGDCSGQAYVAAPYSYLIVRNSGKYYTGQLVAPSSDVIIQSYLIGDGSPCASVVETPYVVPAEEVSASSIPFSLPVALPLQIQ